MELPSFLKDLYKHWEEHTQPPGPSPKLLPNINEQVLQRILSFVEKRMQIWEQKTFQQSPPFTSDPILNTYRFCNIFRELDRQTIAFHTLLKPLENNFPLWLLNMFACRMIARPETITSIGLLSLNPQENHAWYERLMQLPRPRYGTAYVFPISTLQKSSTPTREQFLANHLAKVIPNIANEIISWNKISVYEGIQKILPLFGFNHPFLWTEVLIDVAYQFPQHIDLFKRFPIGPGSLPTCKQLNATCDASLLATFLATQQHATLLTYNEKPLFLSAENWEGIGCEFRKYTNLMAGKGRKRVYVAHKNLERCITQTGNLI